MFGYTPKTRSFLIPLAAIVGGGFALMYPEYAYIGVAVWAVAFVIVLILTVVMVNGSRAEVFDAMARFANEFRRLDPVGRDALGLRYPKAICRYRGRLLVDFEGIGVPMEFVHLFVERSTAYEIFAERYVTANDDAGGWSRDEGRAYHRALREWLMVNPTPQEPFVIERREANNRSWLWRKDMYWTFRDRYAPRALENLGTAEPSPVYVPEAEESEQA